MAGGRLKKQSKPPSGKGVRQVLMGKIPARGFNEWLIVRLRRKKIPLEKRRIQEYNHVYNRVRQVMPQMIDFVETIFKRRKTSKLNRQLVFIGRGARPFYRIAYRLAPLNGVNRDLVRLVEVGRRLTGKIYDRPRIRKQLLRYLQSRGVDIKKPITFIDTGVIGTVPNDLIQLFKLEGLKTKVNGYMFYGRNIRFEGIGQYSPSRFIKWKLPQLSERETRAIIEELPKSTITIRELVSSRKTVRPKYVRDEIEERVGSDVVRKAIMDAMAELPKKSKKR